MCRPRVSWFGLVLLGGLSIYSPQGVAQEQHDIRRPASSTGEARIRHALDDVTTLEFIATPLTDVVEYLKDAHAIPIEMDTSAMNDIGLSTDTPITRNLKGITLRSALQLMLHDLDLTYAVQNEVLLITTPEDAELRAATQVYSLRNLTSEESDAARKLAGIIRRSIRQGKGDDATVPTVTLCGPLLFVRATEEGQVEVQSILFQVAERLGLAIDQDRDHAKGNNAKTPQRETRPQLPDPFAPGPAERDPFGAGDLPPGLPKQQK